MTEKRKDEEEVALWSPYTYRDGLSFLPCDGQDSRGISPDRLTQLLKKGQLTERSEYIIRFLLEFQYLTGYLIFSCFLHPEIPTTIKKLRKEGKNPYRSELGFLSRIGAIKHFSFYDASGSRQSGKIYCLTAGCRTWAQQKFSYPALFTRKCDGQQDRRAVPEMKSLPTYTQMITYLSLSQFHIAVTVNHLHDLEVCQHHLSTAGSASSYISKSGISIQAISVRNYRFTDEIKQVEIMGMGAEMLPFPRIIIILVESMFAAQELQSKLAAISPYGAFHGDFLYCRDNSSMSGKNPLIDELARFTHAENTEYELCSLIL